MLAAGVFKSASSKLNRAMDLPIIGRRLYRCAQLVSRGSFRIRPDTERDLLGP